MGVSRIKSFGSIFTQNMVELFSPFSSDDDSYVMLAAIHAGKGTYIVTNDLFRTYFYKIKCPRAKVLFCKWQVFSVMNHRGRSGRDGEIKVNVKVRKLTNLSPVGQAYDASFCVAGPANPTFWSSV